MNKAKIQVPAEVEAELAIIGGCLNGGLDSVLSLLGTIQPSAWFDERCAAAWAVLEGMARSGAPIDAWTFGMAWRDARKEALPTVFPEAADRHLAATVDYYAQRVRQAGRRRAILLAADELRTKASDPTIEVGELESAVEALAGSVGTTPSAIVDGRSALAAFTDDAEARFARQGSPTGILTGLYDFDRLSDGLQAGELSIVAARPSRGKTSFAVGAIERACLRDRVPTLVVTAEMSVTALMRRLASCFSGVAVNDLRRGNLSESDFQALAKFAAVVSRAPLYWLEGVGGITSAQISSAARSCARHCGLKLVVVDYLQRIRSVSRHEKRTYEVGEVSGALKGLACSLGVAVLAAAQISREPDKDKGRPPRLSDLADSAQIERDADLVALLHREEKEEGNGLCKLIVAKQRDGEVGTVDLFFEPATCRFRSAARLLTV